jgi:hypothetical protein
MVAKLLVAVQEAFESAVAGGEAASLVEELRAHYYDIRAGLGFTKTPEVFGALPLDPYSHTPGFGGAKQPGMTGQVKEEILTRWGELGVHVSDGCIRFAPALLRDGELLGEAATFSYVDGSGASQSIELAPGDLAFTFCQVPVVYVRGDVPSITVSLADGGERRIDGAVLPRDLSADVFNRTARVTRVTVARPAG